jgi:hypothetical protein
MFIFCCEELRLVLLKTKKSISKLFVIWTLLLLFILKVIFPKPAYALLSSLDACAVQPECASVLGSELSPTIVAPTAEAAGTTAISTTTATGATTSSVEAVAGTTVVGDMRLSGVAAFYIWNRGQNQKAQEKAKEKYCVTYPTDSEVCASWTFHGSGVWPGNCSNQYIDYLGTSSSEPQFIPINNFGNYCSAVGVLLDGQRFGGNGYAYFPGTEIKVKNNEKEWKDWPQQKRDAAVRLLNPSDWQGLISSMPAGGLLNPGDKVHAPTIVIPGQETDDPNTPADERLLKKESGFFTNPGRDDFDYDADGTADASDPEPQNPSVPTASGGSSGSSSDQSTNPSDSNPPLDTSQEPKPPVLDQIPETAGAKTLAEAKAAELRNTLPKKSIPSATAAVVDTKTGEVYYGTSGNPLPTTIDEYLTERTPSPSLEPWQVANCAEFKAVNNAMLDGANIEDLEVHTVRTRTGEAFPRCKNCRITTDGTNVTSDP